MDETFNQLAGGEVPIVGLIQTLAEFATAYSNHSPNFTHFFLNSISSRFPDN